MNFFSPIGNVIDYRDDPVFQKRLANSNIQSNLDGIYNIIL
jgi:hypothetical protein